MADFKGSSIVANELPPEMDNPNLSPEKKGTPEDQLDMFRMGKAQVMRVSGRNGVVSHRPVC